MATFGNRPEDSVTDSRGNVRPGVVITVFATSADATANRSALGSVSTGEDGRWPIDVSGKNLVWAREPKGSVWPVTAAEATVADFTDQVNASQAAAVAAQTAAEAAQSGAEAAQTAAEAAASLVDAPADTVVAAIASNPASETVVALGATFATGGQVRSKVKTDGTDQTATLQAELDALRTGGGGTLLLPSGTVTVAGTLTLGNDGATPPKQPTICLEGMGAHWSGRGTAPVGGTILDIKGADTYGKIKTTGLGLLLVTGVTFKDSSGGSTPFLYTTNTTLHIDGCAFVGSKSGTACDQDAIICGGTVAIEGDGDITHGFQGYGTVISRNFFSGIRRAVYGRVYFNANVIRDNTVWSNCGFATGAAIEIDGNPGGDPGNPTAVGNLIAGNLIEVSGYKYAIAFGRAQKNTLVGNGAFDAGASTVAVVRFEAAAVYNTIIEGFRDGATPGVSEAATYTNTVISTQAVSQFALELAANKINLNATSAASSFLQFQRDSVNNWLFYQLSTDGALLIRDEVNARTFGSFTPGSTDDISKVTFNARVTASGTQHDFGPTTAKVRIGSLGTTDAWIDAGVGTNTDINLKLRAKGAGTIQPQQSIVMASGKVIRSATSGTASRPAAAASGKGAMFYDSDLNKPIWSDGASWRDATGTAV